MPWTQEQSKFLEKFYQGVTDPDTKISMLIAATGGGTITFHATELNPSGTGLKGIPDSEVLAVTKIACLEEGLLIQNGHYVPEYY